MTALRQRMLEDLQIRNYSPTIRAYILQVAQFGKHFGKSPDQLGAEHIRAYQLFLVEEGRLSQSTCIQVVCALRFLYTQTLNRQVGIEQIPFPRRERKLPIILIPEEVKALLEAPRSVRHRTLLATMYAAGPRVSEVAKATFPFNWGLERRRTSGIRAGGRATPARLPCTCTGASPPRRTWNACARRRGFESGADTVRAQRDWHG